MMIGILAAAIRRAIAPEPPAGADPYAGVTWTLRNAALANNWQSVCWAPELSRFVAVASTGTGNRVMTSSDGITWQARASAVDNGWISVCWAPELSRFVAVSYDGAGNRVMTSPDGITWQARASAADNQWISVCWSPERSLFVAVAQSGTGNRVMTSPDGVTWTARQSAVDSAWRSVCWSPERSLFVAVANGGTGSRVMTSPDGIVWTPQAAAVANGWIAVCWSPELGLFVAVASTGAGNRVMTSPDGFVWTARLSAANNTWISVCWSPERGMFVAVGSSGVGNRIMTSYDGVKWTTPGNPADYNWQSVCWAPSLSRFVAVSNSGGTDRVATSGNPSPYPTPSGIQFIGSVVRSKPLEDTTTTQFVFPLPVGTKVGDTLVLWTQGFSYDPDHTGWSPALLDDGVTETWGYRTRQVADLSDIVVGANSSRCVAVLWAFSGAGSAPVLRRTGTFQSISAPSGTHPSGPTLPAGAKFVMDIVSSSSVGASADITTPYPAGLVLTKYTPNILGTSQTHSAGMAVGASAEDEYTPPATTWNVTVNMVSNRWCLYAG